MECPYCGTNSTATLKTSSWTRDFYVCDHNANHCFNKLHIGGWTLKAIPMVVAAAFGIAWDSDSGGNIGS